jgi:hypothetical protein
MRLDGVAVASTSTLAAFGDHDMRYLYGDSSAFPLNENFIDTLAAATVCAVALLEVDEKTDRARHVADETNAVAQRELSDLAELAQRVDRALAHRDHLSPATAKVAAAVASDAQSQLDRARAGVEAWCESTIRKAAAGCGPSDVMAPVHRFMVRHQLPYTAWGLRWKAGRGDESTQAQVYAIMQHELTATLAVAIPAKHLWAQPVRVNQLEKELAIQLVGKNWLGREKLRSEPLDKLFVTRVTRTADNHAFVLSRKPKDPSPGLRFQLQSGEAKRVTVQRIDQEDQPIGNLATLEGIDALAIKRLWRRIEETIADLVAKRAQLLAATLHGKRLGELESPAVVAVAIIQTMAPLVHDMARHSRTPGELQLKRDLGDGRREELFVSAAEITGKYARLRPHNRDLFAAFGLDPVRSTSDVVPRAHALEAPTSVPLLPPPPSLPELYPADLVEPFALPVGAASGDPIYPGDLAWEEPTDRRPRTLASNEPPPPPERAARHVASVIPAPQPPRRRPEERQEIYRLPPPSVPAPRRRAAHG